jgi:Fe-S-cluster-containing dehydrogenase component
MSVDRRTVLKGAVAAGAAAMTCGASAASEKKAAPDDAVGMLYDATRCIGCKACVVACRQANNLPYEDPDALWDAPIDLTHRTKNIIKLYQEGEQNSFMKMQCMHCIDPACTRACMIGALKKREFGIVTWDASRCIGCRYCQIACPFEVPKFEWDKQNPKIVKCEMCNHLLAKGGIPGCCDACPADAVIYGKHTDLLADAKQRIADDPERYNPKVYGEHEGGGTQVLYLAPKGVSFAQLGLPELGPEGSGSVAANLQHSLYKYFAAPAALYVALAAVIWRNHGGREAGEAEEGR